MMKKTKCPAAACLAFALFGIPQTHAADVKVKLTACPAAVQRAFQQKAAGGTIGGVEKATDKKGTVFEAEIKTKDGKDIEVIVTPEGKLVATEVKVPLGDCPQAVRKTIQEKARGGKIAGVEKVTAADGKVTYTAEIKPAKGDPMDLEVSESGAVIKFEKDKD